MKFKFLTYVSLLSIAALLIGCDTDTASKEKQMTADSYVPMATFASYESDSTRKGAVEAVGIFNATLTQIFNEKASWSEIDTEVRRRLQGKSGSPYIASLREVAANRTLKHLVDAEPSPERAKAIGRYTSMLVEVEHTDAAVLAEACNALEGHWSKARLASTVNDVLEVTKNECADCGSMPDLPNQEQADKAEAAIANSQARSEAALEILRDLRDRL